MTRNPLKNLKNVNLKIVIRYTLLQIPEFILILIGLHLIRIRFDLADWLFWTVILISAAKDILLFPFIWPAYDWDNPKHKDPMLGMRGVTRERLAPKGYIFIKGELWMAQINGETAIEKDRDVVVTQVKGLTLMVRPAVSSDH